MFATVLAIALSFHAQKIPNEDFFSPILAIPRPFGTPLPFGRFVIVNGRLVLWGIR